MKELIENFLELIRSGKTEIYNEFSLQHELGVYLRNRLSEYKIQFERNVEFFNFDKCEFIKKEIDISVFTPNCKELKYALELKYPRNGQYPEQMFSFCKDIKFLEQLKSSGFESTYFIAVVDERPFYEGSSKGIYQYFRGGALLSGQIQKPTGKKDQTIDIDGCYQFFWQKLINEIRYIIVEINT